MSQGRMRWIAVLVLIFTGAGWASFASPEDQVPEVPGGPPAQVQFQIVHSFGAAGDGIAPGGGMVMDSKGNLYGVTGAGGTQGGGGTVYELSAGANGQWTENILHSFPIKDPSEGFEPIGLVIDGAGNLYGTTQFGGDGQYCVGYLTCGTVYEVSPGANGEWTESILWNFCSLPDCADGGDPLVAPTLGPGGSLFGVAGLTAFQLTPGSGGWTLSALYTFCDETGCTPTSGLTLDAKGNLYGEGGIGQEVGDCLYQFGCGIVFALHQQPNRQWKQIVLWEFDKYGNNDGIGAEGGLTFHDGGLYGVTRAGGSNCVPIGGCGAVFELTRGPGNNIIEQVLWSFGGEGGAQGVTPNGGVAFNKQGDLFGVTGGVGRPGDMESSTA